jgi:hypothetical protein
MLPVRKSDSSKISTATWIGASSVLSHLRRYRPGRAGNRPGPSGRRRRRARRPQLRGGLSKAPPAQGSRVRSPAGPGALFDRRLSSRASGNGTNGSRPTRPHVPDCGGAVTVKLIGAERQPSGFATTTPTVVSTGKDGTETTSRFDAWEPIVAGVVPNQTSGSDPRPVAWTPTRLPAAPAAGCSAAIAVGRPRPAQAPSQRSPTPSPSWSAWSGFGTAGQSSLASGTPSPSASGSGSARGRGQDEVSWLVRSASTRRSRSVPP